MEISEREYKELLLVKENNPCEKWCWVKFLKGWINHKFLAFVITTWRVNILLDKRLSSGDAFIPSSLDLAVVIIWGVVVVAFIFGKSLDIAVENAKISAEIKAGASISKGIKKEAENDNQRF